MKERNPMFGVEQETEPTVPSVERDYGEKDDDLPDIVSRGEDDNEDDDAKSIVKNVFKVL